jgi:hypothetical protein
MLVLWLTCVILTPLTHPTTVAEQSRRETRIVIEQQKTLAFASKLLQEALQIHLQLGSKQEKATHSRAVLTVARYVAQGRLAGRSFADSINDPEIRQKITDMLGIEERGAKSEKKATLVLDLQDVKRSH